MHFYLNILANIILNDYFNQTKCVFVFTDENNDFNYAGESQIIYLKIFDGTIVPQKIYMYFGCHGFLVHSANPCKIFKSIENIIKHSEERFNDRRFIFLPAKNPAEDLLCLFNTTEIEYVDDLLIILPAEENFAISGTNKFLDRETHGKFDLVTHKYNGLDGRKLWFLDTWFSSNNSFLLGRNLYPDKISNQQKKHFRVATFTYPPYAVPGKSPKKEFEFKAIEWKFVSFFQLKWTALN